MKLNNKGFGLKQMLIISAILILFLLIVAYYIISLYNSFDKVASQYSNLESEIKAAAVKYNAIYDAPSVIDLKSLKEAGFIELFTDSNDKDCDGYVKVDGKEFKPYIKCEYYKTRGYKEKEESRY